jgi:hypothetical protein
MSPAMPSVLITRMPTMSDCSDMKAHMKTIAKDKNVEVLKQYYSVYARSYTFK